MCYFPTNSPTFSTYIGVVVSWLVLFKLCNCTTFNLHENLVGGKNSNHLLVITSNNKNNEKW